MMWFALILISGALSLSSAALRISEVLANPATMSDKEGEFLEMYCQGPTDCKGELVLTEQTDTLWQGTINLPAGFYGVLCGSSADFFDPSLCINSDHAKDGLSLPNSRKFLFRLRLDNLLQDSTEIPVSRSGVSWERQGNTWALSIYRWIQDNLATPGFGTPKGEPGMNNATLDVQKTNSLHSFDLRALPNPIIPEKTSLISSFPDRIVHYSSEQKQQLLQHCKPLKATAQLWHFDCPMDEDIPELREFVLQGDAFALDDTVRLLRQIHSGDWLRISEIKIGSHQDIGEWIRLINNGPAPIALQYFQLEVRNKECALPEAWLQRGASVILGPGYNDLGESYGSKIPGYAVPCWPGLRDAGDSLNLRFGSQAIDSILWEGSLQCLGSLSRPDDAPTEITNWNCDTSGVPVFQSENKATPNRLLIPSRFLSPRRQFLMKAWAAISPLQIKIRNMAGAILWSYTSPQTGRHTIRLSPAEIKEELSSGILFLEYSFGTTSTQRTTIICRNCR